MAYLDLDGILRGDILPTVAVGWSFRKHGRPVADARIVRNIGLRRVPEAGLRPPRTTDSENKEADDFSFADNEDDDLALQFHQPSDPSSTFVTTNDSNEDLVQLYTDEDPEDTACEHGYSSFL